MRNRPTLSVVDHLLEVRDLKTYFPTRNGLVKAVDGVTFDLSAGDTLGIVGESGCGKSVTSLSIIGLIPPPGRIVEGHVLFEGRELVGAPASHMRNVRGGKIGYIFQDPMVALNPVMTIGDQITETLHLHTDLRGNASRRRAIDLLDLVGIPAAERRVDNYPHEFSGGMRQRAMIAIGIACKPALLIADEPTTALDVTVQAQILDLIRNLQRDLGMAMILISHDLGVVTEMCRRVMVMYAGRRAELSETVELHRNPAHPYTRGLLLSRPGSLNDASLPEVGASRTAGGLVGGAPAPRRRARLRPIPGMPPDLSKPIVGCAYAPRCELVEERCRHDRPELESIAREHAVACWVAQRDAVHVG